VEVEENCHPYNQLCALVFFAVGPASRRGLRRPDDRWFLGLDEFRLDAKGVQNASRRIKSAVCGGVNEPGNLRGLHSRRVGKLLLRDSIAGQLSHDNVRQIQAQAKPATLRSIVEVIDDLVQFLGIYHLASSPKGGSF
jgi:hypothetical protein